MRIKLLILLIFFKYALSPTYSMLTKVSEKDIVGVEGDELNINPKLREFYKMGFAFSNELIVSNPFNSIELSHPTIGAYLAVGSDRGIVGALMAEEAGVSINEVINFDIDSYVLERAKEIKRRFISSETTRVSTTSFSLNRKRGL